MKQMMNVKQLPAGFYLVTTKKYQNNLLAQQPKQFIGEITGKWEQLPYLSLKENLLLGVDKPKQTRLLSYIKLTELNSIIFSKKEKELTQFDKIRLQFVHLLLKSTSVIYLHDCFGSLTINQVQWLLKFCFHLSQKHSLCILLFSQNKQLLQSPYIDDIF
ncbi:hypothetical protein [Tetragenococcus muriaticus]|uniref:Uncharacterized protein n=2 Tax=Tetragenococcus muriaticus TaxID=64642 RepID=A0A091C4V3_9ENTE|nr:hypothetical protein [Tetragenococcus muriaticus]KFN91904.1 hypothetical protein TMU3MR103_0800 [Tetragenococcus muriaticus 3MR10-3]GMA47536.1 hypothetical protein GCM10025854_17860 [Tetragenococcus muriaticus]